MKDHEKDSAARAKLADYFASYNAETDHQSFDRAILEQGCFNEPA